MQLLNRLDCHVYSTCSVRDQESFKIGEVEKFLPPQYYFQNFRWNTSFQPSRIQTEKFCYVLTNQLFDYADFIDCIQDKLITLLNEAILAEIINF